MFTGAFLMLAGLTLQPSSPAPRQSAAAAAGQGTFEAEQKTYSAETARLRAAASAAAHAEARRQKVTPCQHAGNTLTYNQCLLHQSELTEANYKAFLSALRAILALPEPRAPGTTESPSGPSGPMATPATNIAALDAAEAAWHTYADAECKAVDTEWRGGTIVNAKDHECTMRLARDRLRELGSAYDQFLQP